MTPACRLSGYPAAPDRRSTDTARQRAVRRIRDANEDCLPDAERRSGRDRYRIVAALCRAVHRGQRLFLIAAAQIDEPAGPGIVGSAVAGSGSPQSGLTSVSVFGKNRIVLSGPAPRRTTFDDGDAVAARRHLGRAPLSPAREKAAVSSVFPSPRISRISVMRFSFFPPTGGPAAPLSHSVFPYTQHGRAAW